jgi:hypothetical protein
MNILHITSDSEDISGRIAMECRRDYNLTIQRGVGQKGELYELYLYKGVTQG